MAGRTVLWVGSMQSLVIMERMVVVVAESSVCGEWQGIWQKTVGHGKEG